MFEGIGEYFKFIRYDDMLALPLPDLIEWYERAKAKMERLEEAYKKAEKR